jgi:hypothetical protein
MTGRKSLRQVRAELESTLGAGPGGAGEVAAALRRFLASGPRRRLRPSPPATAVADQPSKAPNRPRLRGR